MCRIASALLTAAFGAVLLGDVSKPLRTPLVAFS
jgi:hypothetical protein